MLMFIFEIKEVEELINHLKVFDQDTLLAEELDDFSYVLNDWLPDYRAKRSVDGSMVEGYFEAPADVHSCIYLAVRLFRRLRETLRDFGLTLDDVVTLQLTQRTAVVKCKEKQYVDDSREITHRRDRVLRNVRPGDSEDRTQAGRRGGSYRRGLRPADGWKPVRATRCYIPKIARRNSRDG